LLISGTKLKQYFQSILIINHHHHADNVQTMDANKHVPEPPIDMNMNTNGMIDIDWQRVLSDPSLVPCFLDEPFVTETLGTIDSTTAGLTYIPWKLRVKVVAVMRDNGDPKENGTASIPVVAVAPSITNDDNGDNKDADSNDNDQKPAAIGMSKNGNGSSSNSTDCGSNMLAQQQQYYFPVATATGTGPDYLSLRRQQNRAWADERLLQGIQYAKEKKYAQARKSYQQGLDLVPNHVDLMVAQAALYANPKHTRGSGSGSASGADYHRALQLLEQALRENPQHANALQYKQDIEAHQQKQQLAQQLALRQQAQRPAKQDRAMQDASLERSFEIGNGGASSAVATNSNETAYPLLGSDSERAHDDDDDDEHDDNDKRRKKKRKHKKRHKKKSKRRHRRRSYYDSDSDTDHTENNDSEPEEDSFVRKRSRGKTKRNKEERRSRDRKKESEPTKEETTAGVPESVVDIGRHHHDKDKDNDSDSSQEESRRGYKRRRKDRTHKRQRRSVRDDVSSSGPPSDSGETVDSLQIGRERKRGRPATRAYRHVEEDGGDETKGG
jgi:tetratricopeptide (TPR) repeat protein